jgi:hypothetical protein
MTYGIHPNGCIAHGLKVCQVCGPIKDLNRRELFFRMPTLAETAGSDPIRAAVWGVSGAGKTTLAGLMAAHEELRPIYFADWDRRIVSLRARVPKEYWQYIHSDVFQDTTIQGGGWTAFEAKMMNIQSQGFKTVVIDSMTFMLMGLMNRVLLLDGNRPSTSNPQLQNYLTQQSMVKDILQKLCAKKINLICTFHEANDKDEYSGRVFKAFAITGKLTETVPGYFNEIWHCAISPMTPGQEPDYIVKSKSDGVYMARTTFKTLKTAERQADFWPKVVKEMEFLSVVDAEIVTTESNVRQLK